MQSEGRNQNTMQADTEQKRRSTSRRQVLTIPMGSKKGLREDLSTKKRQKRRDSRTKRAASASAVARCMQGTFFILVISVSDNSWFRNHVQICQPLTKDETKKMKLPNTYVLIEPLLVPAVENFDDVAGSVKETVEDTLGLECSDQVESEEEEGKVEYSDGELSDDEYPLQLNRIDAKDAAMKRNTLTDMHKTKLI